MLARRRYLARVPRSFNMAFRHYAISHQATYSEMLEAAVRSLLLLSSSMVVSLLDILPPSTDLVQVSGTVPDEMHLRVSELATILNVSVDKLTQLAITLLLTPEIADSLSMRPPLNLLAAFDHCVSYLPVDVRTIYKGQLAEIKELIITKG